MAMNNLEYTYRYGEKNYLLPALYWTPALPNHYVALGDDNLWYLIPAAHNGWLHKAKYYGNYQLQRVDKSTISAIVKDLGGGFDWWTAMTTGWIGSRYESSDLR